MPPLGGNPRPPAPAPKPVANLHTGNNPRGVAIVLPAPKAAPTPQRSTPAYAKAVTSVARTRSKSAGSSVVLQIAQALRLRGLRDAAIAGIIGNAKQESSWNPASMEPGTNNGGLWGFTAPPISLPDLQKFATTQNRSWKDPSVQTDFLLNHMSKGDLKALNRAKTPTDAALWFMNNWERPAIATQNAARRIEGANQAYAMLRALDGRATV